MAKRLSNAEILNGIRNLMKNPSPVGCSESLAAYIVPTEDAHGSEYIADCDKRREFVSGFTGSAGTAVITLDKAALWTDGRYYLQAEQQLDANNWILMKDRLPETPSIHDWLNKTIPPNSKVGTDPFLVAASQWKTMADGLKENGNSLVGVSPNLVDIVWGKNRPSQPKNEIFCHPKKFAGVSWEDKVASLREKMVAKGATVLLLSALDEIAYLLNLRGSDIDFNPVFFAYAVITMDRVLLFVDDTRFQPEIKAELKVEKTSGLHVELKRYDSIVQEFGEIVKSTTGKIWASKRSSWALVQLVNSARQISDLTPVCHMKAVKNEVEIAGMKSAQLKDAVALAEYFWWLDQEVPKGYLTEVTAADHLEKLRRERDEFVSLSFPTISGSGPNGAVIHYMPESDTARKLVANEMYLVDSGAQYRDGTTDITRTYHFGEPTEEEKEAFTLVLKGHIALARVNFPNGTKGNQLDVLARMALWSVGLNYLHGTGHGVGSFLNVHEGPVSVSWLANPDACAFRPGMIVSDEPGFYEDGKYGVRIESLILVREANLKNNFKNAGYMGFEVLTRFPIQTKLVKKELLDDTEVKWLNDFHRNCLEFAGPSLQKLGKQGPYDWLVKATQPI